MSGRITLRHGDLLESSAQTLVNTINTAGVMGKGLALSFKRRFPDMYRDYVERCERGDVRMGEPYLFTALWPPWILNFPTKRHWKSRSRMSDIEAGLVYLQDRYKNWGITSLAVPPLGCGHGGLQWTAVKPLLLERLAALDIPVELYVPMEDNEYVLPDRRLPESLENTIGDPP